jgi:hypothetical protein
VKTPRRKNHQENLKQEELIPTVKKNSNKRAVTANKKTPERAKPKAEESDARPDRNKKITSISG